MIFDRLENLGKYSCVPRVDAIVDFIKSTDVFALEQGDIPILGDDLFVRVLEYAPKPAEQNFFETHRRYADVQTLFRGTEIIQSTSAGNLKPHDAYDEAGDFQFFTADLNVSDIVVAQGEFLVFLPGDPHKPGCFFKEPAEPVRKLVFKTRAERTQPDPLPARSF